MSSIGELKGLVKSRDEDSHPSLAASEAGLVRAASHIKAMRIKEAERRKNWRALNALASVTEQLRAKKKAEEL